MTPKGQKTIWDVLTSFEGAATAEHQKLYRNNSRLYGAAVMYLIAKRVPVRRFLIPKALALAYSEYNQDLVAALHKVATALDVRDAVRLVVSKTYGVSLTGGRHKNRQELVKSYLRQQTPERLQQQILTGGKVLLEIADKSHPHPRDWAGEEWIAKAAYGQSPEDGSLIAMAREFRNLVKSKGSIDKQKEILESVNIPWHYIKESYGGLIPPEILNILVHNFSLRGVIKNIDMFKSLDIKLVKSLSRNGRYLSFTIPFASYIASRSNMYYGSGPLLNSSIRLALLRLASKQFNKLYFNPEIQPVVIGVDVSGSMGMAVEIAATISAMLSSKLNKVSLYSFGPTLTKFKNLPKDLAGAEKMIANVRASGWTNISEFFQVPEMAKAKTVIIISDGCENKPDRNGKYLSDVLPKLSNQRIFYLSIDGQWNETDDPLYNALNDTELWWRMTKLKDISQLDLIIPMLSYDDLYGKENELWAVAGAFVPPLDIPMNICAACNLEVTEPVNIGCQHVFHVDCLKRFWNLLESKEKRCPYGCRPVHKCVNCNGPVGAETTECPHCGHTLVVHI